MELVIKLYSDKPSRIGIRYIYEYLAIREYEDLMRKLGSGSVSVQLEILKNAVNLTLRSDGTGARFTYKDLEFKFEQLKRLQSFFTPGSTMDFVHVFPKNNTFFVAKAFRRSQFLQISEIEFISAGAINLS